MMASGCLDLAGAAWSLSSPAAAGQPQVGPVPAMVPNDLADDLERAGLLPDLWFGSNAMNSSLWVFRRSWTLSRTFETPAAAQVGARSWLAFDGVDYSCSIALNGVELGDHTGAFEPFEIETTGALRAAGEPNELLVRIARPPPELIEQLYSSTDGYVGSSEAPNPGPAVCAHVILIAFGLLDRHSRQGMRASINATPTGCSCNGDRVCPSGTSQPSTGHRVSGGQPACGLGLERRDQQSIF